MSVRIFTISLKKIKKIIEIKIAVKKLSCIEFFTTSKKDFWFRLPIVQPTIPSVEKAYASRKNADKIINCNKIILTAK